MLSSPCQRIELPEYANISAEHIYADWMLHRHGSWPPAYVTRLYARVVVQRDLRLRCLDCHSLDLPGLGAPRLQSART